jgi:broad specificity phosphatase PhoE
MAELVVIRHGVSEGNVKRIIQGREWIYPLTREGVKGVKALAKDPLFDSTPLIISSPITRARQTAAIIGARTNAPVIYDNVLSEVHCGILEGLSHVEAERHFPLFYGLYLKRQDLDGIPGAEKGAELQSRVLVFLERFLDSEILKGVVVSHAGFIRCLVNTALGKPRANPINLSHSEPHIIRPWEKIAAERLRGSKDTKAYRVATQDDSYVMKVLPDSDVDRNMALQKISNRIWTSRMLTPRVLALEPRCGLEGNRYYVQVLDYLGGAHVRGPLEIEKTRLLVNAIGDMHLALAKISCDFDPLVVGTFAERFERAFNSISDSDAKRIGAFIYCDSRRRSALSSSNAVLVDYDLHRANILFQGSDVRKIDLDCVVFGPPDLQLASLVSGLLLEDSGCDIQTIARLWPYEVSPERLGILMLARAFVGAAYFQHVIEGGDACQDNHMLLKRYLETANRINDWRRSIG